MVTAVAVLVWILSVVSIKCCKTSIEHHVKVFFVVIDPKEAYDSTSSILVCGGFYCTVALYTENLVSVIRSFYSILFYSCISAIVQCGDVVNDPIIVRNRLRQGCTMACILFNNFMLVVVAKW